MTCERRNKMTWHPIKQCQKVTNQLLPQCLQCRADKITSGKKNGHLTKTMSNNCPQKNLPLFTGWIWYVQKSIQSSPSNWTLSPFRKREVCPMSHANQANPCLTRIHPTSCCAPMVLSIHDSQISCTNQREKHLREVSQIELIPMKGNKWCVMWKKCVGGLILTSASHVNSRGF